MAWASWIQLALERPRVIKRRSHDRRRRVVGNLEYWPWLIIHKIPLCFVESNEGVRMGDLSKHLMQFGSQFCSHAFVICMHFIWSDQQCWQAHADVLILVFYITECCWFSRHTRGKVMESSNFWVCIWVFAEANIEDHRHRTLRAPFSFLWIQPSCCPSQMPRWTNSHISRFAWKPNPGTQGRTRTASCRHSRVLALADYIQNPSLLCGEQRGSHDGRRPSESMRRCSVGRILLLRLDSTHRMHRKYWRGVRWW